MKWNELYPSSVPPLPSDIDKFVSSPLWSEFCTSVEGTYGVSPRVEYSKCSMAPGWNVKYKKGGRSICTVYPNHGRFYCMLVIGDKKLHGAELIINSCGPYIQELFRRTSQSLGGKWLFIDVPSDAIVQDTLGLIALRMAKEYRSVKPILNPSALPAIG